MKAHSSSPKSDVSLPASTTKWLWLSVLLLALAAFGALWLDLAVAKAIVPMTKDGRIGPAALDEERHSWAAEHIPAWSELRKLFDLCEVYGYGSGVALILVTMIVLDSGRGRMVPRVAACAYISGLASDLVKLIHYRVRPHSLLFFGDSWSLEGAKQTFVLARQISHPESVSWSDFYSFPSGHSALATGLAVALSRCYPQGRVWFYLLAIFVALQRITSLAHFLSDTIAGAAVGLLVSAAFCEPRLCGKFFDRLEREPAKESIETLQ